MNNKIYLIIAALMIVAPLASPSLTVAAEEGKTTLTITVAEEISSLNPLVGNSLVDWFIFNLIYDKLAIYDTSLKPRPWIAEGWEVSEDGTVWTLHLVKNATWHDGTPVTAADVEFTINYIKQHEVSLWMDEVADIESVEALDDYTVTIKTSKPIAYLDTYVFPRLPIIPKHIWEKIEEPELYPNDNPVGNGPFKLAEYKPGEYLRFVANENYWRGKPYIDEIIVKIGLTPDAAFLELKAGKLDILVLSPEYVKEAEKDPNLKVILTEDIYFDYIVLNTQKYPLNIKEFRHAIAYAINKQELVDRILLGYGEPMYSVIPPAYKFWHNPNVTKYEYDPEKAKEILDQLGFKDVDGDGWRETPEGEDLELEILTLSIWPPYVRMSDMISKYLKEVGIKAKITAVEWGEESKRLHDRNFDIATWGYTVAPEPSQFLTLFTNNPPPYWSMGEWVNETYNELFEKQKSLMSLEERREIIHKLQEILAEELPIIPIWVGYVTEAYRVDKFTGWIPMPMGILGIYNKLTWLSVRPVTMTVVSPTTVVTTVTSAVTTTVVRTYTTVTPTTTVVTVSGTPTTITSMITQTMTSTETKVTTIPTTIVTTKPVEVVPPWTYAAIILLIVVVIAVLVYATMKGR